MGENIKVLCLHFPKYKFPTLMKVMKIPKRCCTSISCRKDLVPVEEADKDDKPIKDLKLLINGDVFSKSAQITVLPRDIYTRHKGNAINTWI